MKRGVWIPALCVLVATAAFSILRAEQPNDSAKRPIGKYSRRYQAIADDDAANQPNRSPGEYKEQSFRLQPVKPISEVGATDEPNRFVPQVPEPGQQSAKPKKSSKPFPAKKTGNKNESGVQQAVFELPSKSPKSGTIQQVSGTSGQKSPFEPTESEPKAEGESDGKAGGNPFESKPPVPPVDGDKKDASESKVKQAAFTKTAVKKLPRLSQAPNAPRTPMVTVRWVKKSDINVGQNCRCDLVVKNSGQMTARYVSVEVAFPATVRLISAKPSPTAATDRAVWKFAEIPAGETKTIQITMNPATPGDISLNTAVRLTGMTPGLFTVNEPKLKIAFVGPEKVLVGNPAPQVIEISNPGTGIAKSVSIEATIPGGLQHPAGDRLAMDIGALNPGETRKVRLTLKAITAGKQVIKIQAKSEASLSQSAMQTVAVSAPSLKVTMDGPGLRYVGRNALYTITVKNDGSIATNNVRVLHRLPEGMRFLKADKGGSFSYPRRTIGWFVGRLEPGNSVQVKAIIACTEIGKKQHLAGAVSEQGTKAQTTCTTKVDGIASLAVQIINPDDPIEVGAATTYEIRVKNKGTKADGSIVLVCELPSGMQLLAAKGATRSAAGKGQVVFAPLKTLAPGKTAIYRIQVRGKSAGNQRFRAKVHSASVKEALSYDKLTRFYAD